MKYGFMAMVMPMYHFKGFLIGCVPLQEGDDGMFNRAYYLSGEYGLWRSVLVIGLGVIGAWLYYFALKAIHADINAKCNNRNGREVHDAEKRRRGKTETR